MPRRRCSGMGKKVGKAPKDGKDAALDPDKFTAEDFNWLDDPAKLKAAIPKSIKMVKKERKS
jgi:hypothetical protein